MGFSGVRGRNVPRKVARLPYGLPKTGCLSIDGFWVCQQ